MHFANEKALVIFGVMADKDVEEVVSIVSEIADEVITVTPDNPRAAKSEELSKMFLSFGIKSIDGGSVENGVNLALRKNNGRKIFALGSLYMYPEIRKSLNTQEK